MGQLLGQFASVIQIGGFSANQTVRWNGVAWEKATAGWLDQAQTWAAQQVFLTGTSGQAPLVVRQTGGTAGANEVEVWCDSTNGWIKSFTGALLLDSNGYVQTQKIFHFANGFQDAGGTQFGADSNGFVVGAGHSIRFASAILAPSDASIYRSAAGQLTVGTGGTSGTGSLAALNYLVGTNATPGNITATNSASGAGQTLTIMGSSAGGLSTAAGGNIVIAPGAGTAGGISGSLIINSGIGFFGTTPPASQPAAITAPTGGVVQDAEARTAIAAILAVLKASGGYGLTA